MSKARIFQPDKNAMQSGKAKTGQWILEFVQGTPNFVDNLMGWNGMTDTNQEIRLTFPTPDAAVAYAKREGIPYEVLPSKRRKTVTKAYADNFKSDKRL